MIPKDRLLSGLLELIYVEEGLITMYANFAKALVKLAEDVEEAKKTRMEKILTKLYRDSSKHKEMLDNLIEKVKKAGKSEY